MLCASLWYLTLDSNQLSPGYESGAYPHKLLRHITGLKTTPQMTDLIPQLLVGKGSFHENKRQWCSKPDLNRHALRQKFLRLSWLPISPFEHINALMYSYICGITGFCDYTKFQKYLISPGYKKPANPFIRTKGFDKTTTSSCLFFQSNKRSCLLLQKPPFLFLRGKKERILISQTVLLFMSAKKVLIN